MMSDDATATDAAAGATAHATAAGASATPPLRTSDDPAHAACIILGAGEYYGSERRALELAGLSGGASDPLVIAADGGLDHARELGVSPDFAIGDFDSVTSRISTRPVDGATIRHAPGSAESRLDRSVRRVIASGPWAGLPVITLPSQKDDADMMSAVKAGWMAGARQFHILGGLGGRLDHTIGNIQLLAYVSRAAGFAFLYGDRIAATAVTDGEVRFPACPVPDFPMVSVFSLGNESHDVEIRGLKYEVSGFTVTNTVAQLSNELMGAPGVVRVGDGTLIVTYPSAVPAPVVTTRARESASLGALSDAVSDRLSDAGRRQEGLA